MPFASLEGEVARREGYNREAELETRALPPSTGPPWENNEVSGQRELLHPRSPGEVEYLGTYLATLPGPGGEAKMEPISATTVVVGVRYAME